MTTKFNKIVMLIISGLVVLVLAANIHIYNGLNKGFYMDVLGQTIGVELVGTPSIFIGDY